MNFAHRFFSRIPKLSEIESRVLKDVECALHHSLRPTFSAQVSKITKIQRLDKGREVDFYFAAGDSSPLFQDLAEVDELKLASLHIKSVDSGHQARADVWLVRGRLFSIEFNAPPGDLKGERLLSEVVLHFPQDVENAR